MNLLGTVTVEFGGRKHTVHGKDFSLEEDQNRHLGEGDFQYEALFIYFDPDQRFKILVQATKLDGNVTLYDPSVEGNAKIVDDSLDVSD